MRSRGLLGATAAAFALSGAAALIYQVVWQRLLALHTGVGSYSIAVIVGAFMAGLGLGSALGGRWAARLEAGRALACFALVELAVGAFGACSDRLYHDWLYGRAGALYSRSWGVALGHLLALLPPTLLMGASLPLLVRATVHDLPRAARRVGVLYATNLLGAALGAALAPWVLVRLWGLRGALRWAAAANLAAALLALAWAWARRAPAPQRSSAAAAAGSLEPPPAGPPDTAPPSAPAAAEDRPRLRAWLLLYACSGFGALSLEMLWFRLLEVALKASAFTFGTLLCLYLLGSAVGCFAAAWGAPRLRRPLRFFLVCQCLLLAYSGAAVTLLVRWPAQLWPLPWFMTYWARGGGEVLFQSSAWGPLAALYLGLPLFLFGPPTLLMGLSFPALQAAVHQDALGAARRVGWLQAANIAGCLLGSLVVGLGALQVLGTSGSLRLLLGLGGALALVGVRRTGAPRLFGGLLALLALLAATLPGQRELWLRLHGSSAPSTLVAEDATGVGAIVRRGNFWVVFAGGRGHSWVPYAQVHTALGAAPALVHPAPREVAIVGLGSGNTAWAAACRPETRQLEVFEISGPQPRLLQALDRREVLPDLRRLLSDARLRLRVADGRQALLRGRGRYDLIEADALWADAAYSGNLYSREFFELCRARLKPGGLVCTWAPTPRVRATFAAVFPHVLATQAGHVLIGSPDPIAWELTAWRRRLRSPAVSGYLGESGVRDALGLIETLVPLGRLGPLPALEPNLDLFPRDEFMAR